MTRHSEMQVGQLVGYWPTEQVCRVVRAVPVGYTGWRYYVSPVGTSGIIYPCSADELVRFPSYEDLRRDVSPCDAAQTLARVHNPPPAGASGPATLTEIKHITDTIRLQCMENDYND